jgi:uncharacterized protein (DUF2147 family)
MNRRIFLAALLSGLAGRADAQNAGMDSPAGLWRTFDDRTGRERGVIRIDRMGDTLSGTIVGTVDPADAVKRCDRCEGERHGQATIGLTIITGMRRDGEEWSGGRILDPETGSLWRCRMELRDGGRALVVRGYLGISLLGRSQTWIRVP